MSLLTLKGISKEIQGNCVLENVSFSMERFTKFAIAGATGSGKTTLLKIIAGLMKPDAGEVYFEGSRLPGPDEKLIPGHEAIGWLSQQFELRNNYRVEELLEYANELPVEDAEAIFDICRVDHLLKRRTDQLSGGEKQRIAITRLLISSPRLLLLDEPFSNLDMLHKQIMKSVIHDIGEKLKITCILISHDPLDTLSWANELLVLNKGSVIQHGPPRLVYQQPVDEYTASLFGTYTLLSPDMFRLLAGRETAGDCAQPIMIRPENFRVTKERHHGLRGVVTKILFLGAYEEVQVLINDSLVTIRSANGLYGVGDEVWVAIDIDKGKSPQRH